MPDLHIVGDPEADAPLSRDPLALLLGMLLDQHKQERRGPEFSAKVTGDAARAGQNQP